LGAEAQPQRLGTAGYPFQPIISASRQRGFTNWLVSVLMMLLGACILGLGVSADLFWSKPHGPNVDMRGEAAPSIEALDMAEDCGTVARSPRAAADAPARRPS